MRRLQKNSLEHNDCLYVASVLQWRIREPPTDNNTIPQNYFQTNCQIVTPMFLKSTGTTLGQYFFKRNFADLGLTEFHMFFLTWLNCLRNFQADILSNKEAILWRCTLKLRIKLATMLNYATVCVTDVFLGAC